MTSISAGPLHQRSRRHYLWLIAAVVMVVGGTVASVAAAGSIADNNAANSRKSLQRSAAGIAASLQLAITHLDDLAVNASGFLVTDPGASQSEFMRWAQAVQLLQRYPAVQGIGALKFVPASQLAAFAGRSIADPAGQLTADGGFTIVPPGPRAFYCLVQAGLGRPTQVVTPAGFDYCAGSGLLLSARASGQASYYPYADGSQTWLAIETPFYSDRGGAVDRCPARQRIRRLDRDPGESDRSAEPSDGRFSDDVGIDALSRRLVGRELHLRPGPRARPTMVSVSLGAGGPCRAQAPSTRAAIFSDTDALELLIVGIGFSVLLGHIHVRPGHRARTGPTPGGPAYRRAAPPGVARRA